MSLRQAAQEMRDLYANEIARAIYAGRLPEPFSVTSWARYDAELTVAEPFKSRSGAGSNNHDGLGT